MKKTILFLLLIICTNFIFAGVARWVNNTGGTAPSEVVVDCIVYATAGGTYTTIQAAINAAASTDVVYITDGTYTNPSIIADCDIQGLPGNNYLTIFGKSNLIITSSTGSYCNSAVIIIGYGFAIGSGSNITIQGLELQNCPVNAFYNSNGEGPLALYAPTPNVSIKNNYVFGTHGHGIKTDDGGNLGYINRGTWEISGNKFENIGFYLPGSCTAKFVSAIWLAQAGSYFNILNNTIKNTKFGGILCIGQGGSNGSVVGMATISGNRIDQTVDAGIQIGFPSTPVFYYPNGATITHNKITNANTSNKVGIGGITILQSNIYGVNISYNDISTSFNGLALQIAGWQNSPDTKLINNNNIYNLTAGSFGATHIAGISPNCFCNTQDNLLLYNLTNNYWGAATGPTYTTNPSGTGVGLRKETTLTNTSVPYSLNDFSFTPFLTSPATVNSVVECATTPTTSNTIALSSAAATKTQTVCVGSTIAPITFSTSGATGATVTGLPGGIIGSWVGNVVTINGAPTTAGAATYTVTLTGGCGALTQTGTITATALSATLAATAGGATLCQSNTVAAVGSTYSNAASCNRIAKVIPSGALPVNGVINSCVKIDASVTTYSGVKYVQRHFDIEPATGAATATGTITLYFTQSEMTNFNIASPASAQLMTGPADVTGKANLIITQFHGTGTLPSNYTGSIEYINPNDANIVWNASENIWEVTFNVNGFSGFYATSITVLPINLIGFSGSNIGANNQLQWSISNNGEALSFDIERSIDGVNFNKIGTVNAQRNTSSNKVYSFNDNIMNTNSNKFHYRLKMIDITGNYKYSAILKINLTKIGFFVEANPNPFKNNINVMVETAQSGKASFQLKDLNGKIVKEVNNFLQKGSNVIQINNVHSLPSGIYMLSVINLNNIQIIKILKQ